MTIYDVAKLSADEARNRVRATLERHPTLQRLYSDDKIEDLVRRRQAPTNYLLFWLVLPVDDERSVNFWSSIIDDLEILEPRGSFEAFRDKMQHEEKEKLSSWMTELWMAAWLMRNGITVTLEPPVGDKRPELMTETDPPTWWEVKTPLELRKQRTEYAALAEAQRRLREIPEPFVLSILRAKIALADVPGAIKEIRAQIAAFAEAKGEPPIRFESAGLVVEVSARTKHRPTGFLGTTLFGYMFGNEHAEQIGKNLASAVPQLPDNGAGVIVIDRTLSDWNHEEDAIDACYGVEGLQMQNGDIVQTRSGGFFRPGGATRISAVVAYSRHPKHWEYGPEILVIHNPFAKVPLPEDLFRFPGLRHIRRVDNADGSFGFSTTGGGDTDRNARA